MRHGVLVLAGLALAQPLHGQRASVDSAAIVALELEMSRLLAAGQVERITKTFVRQQGQWLLAALHSSGTSER